MDNRQIMRSPLFTEKFFTIPQKFENKDEQTEYTSALENEAPKLGEDFFQYLHSSMFDLFKNKVKILIDDLKAWITWAWQNESKDCDELIKTLQNDLDNFFRNKFALEKNQIKQDFFELYNEGVPKLSNLLFLLRSESLDLSFRKSVLQNLTQSLGECPPGDKKQIIEAHDQLASEAPFSLMAIRAQLANQAAQELIREHAYFKSQVTLETHVASNIVNHFSDNLGLEKISDFYQISEDHLIHYPQYTELFADFPRRLQEILTPAAVINAIMIKVNIYKKAQDSKQALTYKTALQIYEEYERALNVYGADPIFNLNDLVDIEQDNYYLKHIDEIERHVQISLLHRLATSGYLDISNIKPITINPNHEYVYFLPGTGSTALFFYLQKQAGGTIRKPFISYLKELEETNKTAQIIILIQGMSQVLEFIQSQFRYLSLNTQKALIDKLDFVNLTKILTDISLWVDIFNAIAELNSKILITAILSRTDFLNKILHFAAHHGHEKLITELAEEKIDLNQQNQHGSRPLHLAVINNHSGVLNILIHAGAKPDLPDSLGRRPLHLAARHDRDGMIETLITAGADPNKTDIGLFSPAHVAAKYNKLKAMRALANKGANLNQQDNDGFTPAHFAALFGHTDIIQTLIESKADLNQANNEGSAPVHLAAINNQVEVIRTLSKERTNLDQQDGQLRTAVHFAVIQGHEQLIEVLAKAEADLNLADKDGCTPACHAIFIHNSTKIISIFKLLISYQVDLLEPLIIKNKAESLLQLAKKFSKSQLILFLSQLYRQYGLLKKGRYLFDLDLTVQEEIEMISFVKSNLAHQHPILAFLEASKLEISLRLFDVQRNYTVLIEHYKAVIYLMGAETKNEYHKRLNSLQSPLLKDSFLLLLRDRNLLNEAKIEVYPLQAGYS